MRNLDLLVEKTYDSTDVACYLTLPLSAGTPRSLNGSVLHITLSHAHSTEVLGNFSVPLRLIPNGRKGIIIILILLMLKHDWAHLLKIENMVLAI